MIRKSEDQSFDEWRDSLTEEEYAEWKRTGNPCQHIEDAMCESLDRISEAVLVLKQLGQWPEGVTK